MENRHEHLVGIYELDIYGHANHVQYLHWLEEGRERLLRTRGLSFVTLGQQDRRLVIVNVRLDYRAALSAGDAVSVRTAVGRLGRSSVRFDHRIETAAGATALEGEVTMVFVDGEGGPVSIPERFRRAFSGPAGP